MANDMKDDDEFHFGESQIESAGHVSTSPFGDVRPSGITDIISKKRVIITGVIALVALLGYKLIGVFIETRKNYQAEPPKPHVIEVAKPKPIKKIEVPAVVTPKVEVPDAKMLQLENKIAVLQQDIGSLNGNITHLNQVITEQQQYIQTMQDLLKKQAKKTEPVKPKKVSLPHYSIKAMIPGRAWLMQDGRQETVTVTYGDNLPGNGRIKTMDPNNGTILTTEGILIQFSEDDR